MKRNTVKNPVGYVKWGKKSQISFAQHAWHVEVELSYSIGD